MRFNKKQIDEIVLKLKAFVVRIEQAHREIIDCEQKSGLSLKEFRKTLREIRSSSLRQRAVAKKLGIRPDEIEGMSRVAYARARSSLPNGGHPDPEGAARPSNDGPHCGCGALYPFR